MRRKLKCISRKFVYNFQKHVNSTKYIQRLKTLLTSIIVITNYIKMIPMIKITATAIIIINRRQIKKLQLMAYTLHC